MAIIALLPISTYFFARKELADDSRCSFSSHASHGDASASFDTFECHILLVVCRLCIMRVHGNDTFIDDIQGSLVEEVVTAVWKMQLARLECCSKKMHLHDSMRTRGA